MPPILKEIKSTRFIGVRLDLQGITLLVAGAQEGATEGHPEYPVSIFPINQAAVRTV